MAAPVGYPLSLPARAAVDRVYEQSYGSSCRAPRAAYRKMMSRLKLEHNASRKGTRTRETISIGVRRRLTERCVEEGETL
jgi:hypothetical protein